MKEIDFSKIEKKWQKKWEDKKAFVVKEDLKKKKYYVLEMFPYPSGSGLHMGHAFNYTIGDIRARYMRMKGFNVLYPMGYDAFGLPAENAAIQAKTHPKKYTQDSIKNFIKQQKALGLSYDWNRMVVTADEDYYKWNQFFFLKLLEKGLVYRKRAPVNWCSKCDTVLANEQVHNGKCWRHENTDVETKHLEQWFIKTTDYADELLDKVDDLDWPQRIKTMQKNWIGKSYGTEIDFEIEGKKWPIFTTRPDTIYGVTFMVISAQHLRLMEIVTKERKKDVENFLKKIKSTKQEDADKLDKEGVFTGAYAVNPVNGKRVPVYAGNFVVADYGSGMVMAVPAHDKRDYDFAQKYGIEMIPVIEPVGEEVYSRKGELESAYVGKGRLINSDKFNGLDNEEAKKKISEFLEKKKIGKKSVQFKLKDWLVSRQRYWGTPIPVVYCDECCEGLNFNNYKSYLMGASQISDAELNKIGLEIVEKKKDGDRLLLIPNKKIESYLKLIEKKLDNGFWNEVVGNEVIFVFKSKDGKVKRFVLNDNNSATIAKMCAEFSGEDYERTSDLLGYLFDNDFYKDYVNKIRNRKSAVIPVPEKDLPVKLPEKVTFGKGNPLASNKSFVDVKCPKCKGKARRETDTMDTFFDSSWYFLRYCDSKNSKIPFDKKKESYWMSEGVDTYIGGAEHATMHLIYARFFAKALRDLGFVGNEISNGEPFKKLFNQGLIHGSDGNKMSKSLGNVVNPLEIIEKLSADSLRIALISIASPDSNFNWDEKAVSSSQKFVRKVLEYFNGDFDKSSRDSSSDFSPNSAMQFQSKNKNAKLHNLAHPTQKSESLRNPTRIDEDKNNRNRLGGIKIGKSSRKFESKLNKAIKEISFDVENFRYNLATIKLRSLFDAISSESEVSKSDVESFVKMFSVFCPHVGEELWEGMKGKGFVSLSDWPTADEKKIDLKLEQAVQAVDKTVSDVVNILRIIEERGADSGASKIYLYVMPFEKEFYDAGEMSRRIGKEVVVYAVNEKNIYDPDSKSSKAKPGRPGIFVE